MNTIKSKLCAIVLSVVMAMSLTPAFALAQEPDMVAGEVAINNPIAMVEGDVITGFVPAGTSCASTNPSIAWVDNAGSLNALQVGTTTISATSETGETLNYEVSVSDYTDGSEVVGKLKLLARFNDSMQFYDGHAYLLFTSYKDGVEITVDDLYGGHQINDQYYTDIREDIANGSNHTGTDAEKYFTFDENMSTVTLNRGEIVTIGMYRGFDLSVYQALLGCFQNSTVSPDIVNAGKTGIVLSAFEYLDTGKVTPEVAFAQLATVAEELGTDTGMLFNGVVEGGVCFNRELYNQKLEWDQYENVTYELEITQNQLDKMAQTFNGQLNKFSILKNSCATVALRAWNAAVGTRDGHDTAYKLDAASEGIYKFVDAPKGVRDAIVNRLPGYYLNNAQGVAEPDAGYQDETGWVYVSAPEPVPAAYSPQETPTGGNATEPSSGNPTEITPASATENAADNALASQASTLGATASDNATPGITPSSSDSKAVGRLTIWARPISDDEPVPHGAVAFTTYSDISLDVSCYHHYKPNEKYINLMEDYRDHPENYSSDPALFSEDFPLEDRESYFDIIEYGSESEARAIDLKAGETISVSNYSFDYDNKATILATFENSTLMATSAAAQETMKQWLLYKEGKEIDGPLAFDSIVEMIGQMYVISKATGYNPADGHTIGGIAVNREMYNQFRRNDSQMPNTYYTIEITASELDAMKAYLANPKNNYYSLFNKNCASGAIDMWNATLYDHPELKLSANYAVITTDPESLYVELGLLRLKSGIEGEGGTNFYPRTVAYKPVEKPAATSIKKLTAAKNSFKVKWKKQAGVTGYKIRYSTSKSFKKNTKTVTVAKATANTKKVTGLKANKKYYVKVRTYKVVDGTKYFSTWSKPATVKTK